jgi:hypothetical protein
VLRRGECEWEKGKIKNQNKQQARAEKGWKETSEFGSWLSRW